MQEESRKKPDSKKNKLKSYSNTCTGRAEAREISLRADLEKKMALISLRRPTRAQADQRHRSQSIFPGVGTDFCSKRASHATAQIFWKLT